MAIADLLWACPLCGLDRGLRTGEDPDTCGGCGTRFQRVQGARIRAHSPEGAERVLSPAEWVDRLRADHLPDPAELVADDSVEAIRSASVSARFVDRYQVVTAWGRYVNRIEIFGASEQGSVALFPDRLSYTPQGGGGADPTQAGPIRTWQFADLKAVQASSRTLQLRGTPHPLVSFAFPGDSSFLWEQLLERALRGWYRKTGRGEIVELQPRIVTA